MKTHEMLNYVRDIGALGGALTLEYNSGEITLTGEELVQAAADYEMSEPFTIVPASTDPEPWELNTSTENATPDPLGNEARTLAIALVAVAFIGVGLMLL